jgi:hypothetical protein
VWASSVRTESPFAWLRLPCVVVRVAAWARRFAWPRGLGFSPGRVARLVASPRGLGWSLRRVSSAGRFAARLGGGAPPRTTSGAASRCGVRSLTSAIPPPWLARPGVKHPKNQNEDVRAAHAGRPTLIVVAAGRSTEITPPKARLVVMRPPIDLATRSMFCVWVVKPQAEPAKAVGSQRSTSGHRSEASFARCPRRGTAAEPRGEATKPSPRGEATSRAHAARRTAERAAKRPAELTRRSDQPRRPAKRTAEPRGEQGHRENDSAIDFALDGLKELVDARRRPGARSIARRGDSVRGRRKSSGLEIRRRGG